jgi:hypothetical protein
VIGSPAWRELLGKIIRDPQDKQRIAHEIGISSITLLRWVSGESKPRVQNLRLLLNALPEHRQQLCDSLLEDFGNLFVAEEEYDNSPYDIPSVFYARVIHAHCTLPRILHFSSICDIVLMQALKQLDSARVGMRIAIVQCTYSAPGKKVRSLRESASRSTLPSQSNGELLPLFLGRESVAGSVVASAALCIIKDRHEGYARFPSQWENWQESILAYPILLTGRIAGCLLVASVQPNCFRLPTYQKLIRRYAELLTVAFEPDAFYTSECIELGQMPCAEKQRSTFVSLRQRHPGRAAGPAADRRRITLTSSQTRVRARLQTIFQEE